VWTDADFSETSEKCSLVCSSSCVHRTYHVPFRVHKNTRKRTSITKCLVNSRKYTSKRNPSIGKKPLVFFYSITCIAIAKSIHKMHVTIFHVGKHKRLFSNSVQLTYQPFTTLRYTALHITLKQVRVHVQFIGLAWAELPSYDTAIKDGNW